MNPATLLALLTNYGPTLLQVIGWMPTIQGIVAEAASNDDITTKIKKVLPDAAAALEAIGGQLFPKAAPALHIAAVAMTSFDPNTVKWVQGGCNQLLTPSPNLAVDGIAGSKTQAAVIALQEKYGIKADGVPGQVTQALIAALLTKLSPTVLTPAPAKAA